MDTGVQSYSKEDLTRIGNAIYKAEATFFGQQNDRIRTYLQRRHFSGEEKEGFLASGLWMRIIPYTYLNFTQLRQSLMHLSLTQGYTSLAEQIKCFHSIKLAQIRLYSPRYSVFLLRTYAYLCDASPEGSMMWPCFIPFSVTSISGLFHHCQTLPLLKVETGVVEEMEVVVVEPEVVGMEGVGMEVAVAGAVLGATVQISTSNLELMLDRINALSNVISFAPKPTRQQKRFWQL